MFAFQYANIFFLRQEACHRGSVAVGTFASLLAENTCMQQSNCNGASNFFRTLGAFFCVHYYRSFVY